MDYGKQINRLGWLDNFLKTKSRIIVKRQFKLLDGFAVLPFQSIRSKLFARISRKLVGGYIYSIKLEVNDYCNLKCKMCYVEMKKKTNLAMEHIYRLLDQISGFGIRLELLGGEPLMRDDIYDIIRYAKEKSHVPFISLYTNGTVVQSDMAKQLKNAGLDVALVTLVSHKQQVHDSFTGCKGSWQKTINGILTLRDAGIETYSFTTVHNANIDHYREIYRYVKENLDVHSLFYQYIPQQKDDPLIVSKADWNEVKKWVLLEANPEHMKFVRDFYLLTGNACSGGNFVLTVRADGNVQPCPFIYDLPMGNIKEQGIWEIYSKRFKNDELKHFKSLPEECKPCAYSSICGGGCKAGNDKQYGCYDHKDIRCLGPFKEVKKSEEIMADIPTFF